MPHATPPAQNAFFDFDNLDNAASLQLPLLLAESDPQTRRVLARLFSAGGYDVTCVEDGVDALERARSHAFSLVVLNLELPRLNGVALAGALADHDPYLECVLLANKNDLARVIEASEAGNVYNHFWLPIADPGDLLRSAARALERRDLRLKQAALLAEARDARQELTALCQRLEQLDKVAALGQMTGAVAQDLDSPLNALLAYAQYLRARLEREVDAALTPEQVARVLDYMREMEVGVRKCQRTVKGVLEFTRVHDAPPGPVVLPDVIASALELVRHSLEAREIYVRLQMPPGLPPLLANPSRLQQVLLNIVLNAQQAIGTGGGVITIVADCDESPDAKASVRVRIADSGPGIAPGALGHVFDPFFTTRPRHENLGLGLTIVRSILREWRGDVRVTSAPGQGATVTLTLPACQPIALGPPTEDEDAATQSAEDAVAAAIANAAAEVETTRRAA